MLVSLNLCLFFIVVIILARIVIETLTNPNQNNLKGLLVLLITISTIDILHFLISELIALLNK